MEGFGIFADINVEFPKNINIILNDIIILSNLLDNAIEAIEQQQGDKKISLIIRKLGCFIFIRVANPCKSYENV